MNNTQAELLEAAEAVIARWDSPKWKDEAPTADYIARLRRATKAVRATPAQDDELPPLPVARRVMDVVDEYGSGATCYIDSDMREYGAACRAAGVAEGRAYQHKVEAKIIERTACRAGAKQGGEDARDAARYRWLCQDSTDMGGSFMIEHRATPESDFDVLVMKFVIDRTIDAARTSQPGGSDA